MQVYWIAYRSQIRVYVLQIAKREELTLKLSKGVSI